MSNSVTFNTSKNSGVYKNNDRKYGDDDDVGDNFDGDDNNGNSLIGTNSAISGVKRVTLVRELRFRLHLPAIDVYFLDSEPIESPSRDPTPNGKGEIGLKLG
jgi:hypothetical protein